MPPPAMIDDKVRGHALAAIAGAYFNAGAIERRHEGKQVQQNPIFLELRVFLKSHISKAGQHVWCLLREETITLHEPLLGDRFIMQQHRSALEFQLVNYGRCYS